MCIKFLNVDNVTLTLIIRQGDSYYWMKKYFILTSRVMELELLICIKFLNVDHGYSLF
jgi:hypothetical protein